MRLRLLAVALSLLAWASSPVVGLVVSVHVLQHEAAAGSLPVEPILIASHGHHHELDVPDHTHEIIQATGFRDAGQPLEQPGLRPSRQELRSRLTACPTPAGLPPPELHILCAMLL